MRFFVAGHRGMVGSAIVRRLAGSGVEVVTRRRDELDLTDQREVRDFLQSERIDAVILAAAKVGGIHANNTYPAEFIYENLMIETNVIHESYAAGIKRLLFLGSSCIYPRDAEQPMSENDLLKGPLEPTNEPYAIAKIAGIKLCESYNRQYGTDYRSVMPTNLYGPGDNFHPINSHVIPAMMRRFYEAVRDGNDEVIVWGSGKPMREFLHVDDMADASIYVLNIEKTKYVNATKPMQSHINIGTGKDLSIQQLAATMAVVTNFQGRVIFDTTKPDGAPRKLLDISRLERLGWRSKISLLDGLKSTYAWFLENYKVSRL